MTINPYEAAEKILRALEKAPNTNETSRRELFIGNIIALFPKYAWQIFTFALGAEQIVKIPSSLKEDNDVVAGRIDTKKGTLIIEYKTSVKRLIEQEKAENQLKKYVAGIVNKEGRDAVSRGISSDIINWHEYTVIIEPDVTVKRIRPENVILTDKRSYIFSSDRPREFVEVIERLVFKEIPIVANARIIVDEFGLDSKTYKEFKSKLEEIWQVNKDQSEVKLGLTLWSRFISNCFDQSAKPDEDTYLDHTYLVILSRLLAGYAISSVEEQTDPKFPIYCVNGEFFQSGTHRVLNFVENDFFRWINREDILKELDPYLHSLHRKLEWLDFRSAKKFDLLTELYTEIMPPEHKAEYGEVYTPNWLVNKIVDGINGVEEEGTRFLDPACGTGSFLRSVLVKKMDKLDGNYSKSKILEVILSDVCGLDINPISIIIAKSTIMLTISDLLKNSDYPIELPVYLSDSLFSPELRVSPSTDEMTVLQIDSEKIELPDKLFTEGNLLFDQLIHIVSSLAKDTGLDIITIDSAKKALETQVIDLLIKTDYPENERNTVTSGLENIFDVLLDRIRQGRNNVWAFVLKNTHRPSMLKGRFDVIASNPPWLAMSSFPSATYKTELESLIERYDLAPAGQSKHHMEISTVFGVHCANTYLKDNSKFVFILPRVILNGFHHEPLRQSKFIETAPLSIEKLWDLIDVDPLFKRPACVAFGYKQPDASGFPDILPCSQYHGDPFQSLQCDERELVLTTLGGKSSYSYSTEVYHEASTRYKSGFKQGADIMPRRAVIVNILNRMDSAVLSIKTSNVEINNPYNKPPYNEITLRGNIERQYIFNTLKSDAVLPFVSGKLVYTALSVKVEDDSFRILEIDELAELGHNHAKDWFQKVNRTLVELSQKELNSWLKRRNKLTDQSPEPCNSYVLYGAGGKNVTSTVIDTNEAVFPFINDQTLYAWKAPSKEEAYYLCGMLNSDPINSAIKSKQPLGLFGEQHIHELPLLLIPRFDIGVPKHIEISKEAQRLHDVALQIVQEDATLLDPTQRLASRRRRFSRHLISHLEKLNSIADSLLEVPDNE